MTLSAAAAAFVTLSAPFYPWSEAGANAAIRLE